LNLEAKKNNTSINSLIVETLKKDIGV